MNRIGKKKKGAAGASSTTKKATRGNEPESFKPSGGGPGGFTAEDIEFMKKAI